MKRPKCPKCEAELRLVQSVQTSTFDVLDTKNGKIMIEELDKKPIKTVHCWECDEPLTNFKIV